MLLLCVSSGDAGPQQKSENRITAFHLFDGQWMPDVDPILIGPKNYQSLINFRPKDGFIQAVLGYSKINSNIINSTYYKARSGFHFKKDNPRESHVLIQAYNYNLSQSAVIDNETAIPGTGEFNGAILHVDESYGQTGGFIPEQKSFFVDYGGAYFINTPTSTGGVTWVNIQTAETIPTYTESARFSDAPFGHVVYCNGAETQIWGGNEMPVAAFITATAAVTHYVTGARDFTENVNNTYTDTSECAGVSAYGTWTTGTTAYWLVGSTRPLSGISHYVQEAQQETGHAVHYATWDGTKWQDQEETDGTAGLTQDGQVSFTSTVGTAKQKYLEGRSLYWYLGQCEVEGGVSLSHVALNAPWQDLVDIWDLVPRQPIAFHVKRNNEDKNLIYEVLLDSPDAAPIGAEMGGIDSSRGDYADIIFEDRMQAITFDMASGNTEVLGGVSLYTWNGAAFELSSVTYDATSGVSGLNPLITSGTLSWSPPDDDKEFPKDAYGVHGYIYRIYWNGVIGGSGAGDDNVIIDTITGVPAPRKLYNYKFPAFYKGRTFLFGYLKGNEGNRADYCATDQPDVWNGEETSAGEAGPLYFGQNEDVTAAITLYNRYGSNLYEIFLVFKANEIYSMTGDGPDTFQIDKISDTMGCPAPFTLCTAEVGYEMLEAEVKRSMAMWLSSSGPLACDAGLLNPIPGIDRYFDPQDSLYVGASEIKEAFAWFDNAYKEWNLRVADYWFVYDFIRRKWYRKDTGSSEMIEYAIPVTDLYGNYYVYAGIDTGYLMRLEDGGTWDGESIQHIARTGDFYPSDSPWHISIMDRIKLITNTTDDNSTLYVKNYKDLDTSGNSLYAINMTQSDRVMRNTFTANEQAWVHSLEFSIDTSGVSRAELMGFGFEGDVKRFDH